MTVVKTCTPLHTYAIAAFKSRLGYNRLDGEVMVSRESRSASWREDPNT